jgi:DNA-binding MarR family transcriptional regulator
LTPDIDPTVQKLLNAFFQFRKVSIQHKHELGCTPSELRVLFCVHHGRKPGAPDLKVSDISRILHVAPPTVTQLLNSLEERGLVERHVDANDRRVVGIRLTEKAEQVHRQARKAYFATIHELVDYLGEAESNQLAELLGKVYRFYAEKAGREFESPWGMEEHNKVD